MPRLKHAKRKGNEWEREVEAILKRLYPDAARGHQQRSDEQTEPDVLAGPIGVECKSGRVSLPAALRQAMRRPGKASMVAVALKLAGFFPGRYQQPAAPLGVLCIPIESFVSLVLLERRRAE